MDPARALADLREISAQIEAAVIFDDDGSAIASTVDDEERAARIARAAWELLASAPEGVVQLQAALEDGSVFVVREGGRAIAATTGPEPMIGVVMYDLRTCLQALDGETQLPARAGSRASGPS